MKKNYYLQHREEILKRAHERYLKKHLEIKEYARVHRIKNIERVRESEKKYRLKNKKLIAMKKKEWAETNRGKRNQQLKHRYDTDIQYKLQILLRTRMKMALRNDQKVGSAIRDLGCTIAELKFYLEGKFQDGMTWENHGTWHIDHEIPLTFYDLTDREQFLKACHYTNLQPMWAVENMSKKNKILSKK